MTVGETDYNKALANETVKISAYTIDACRKLVRHLRRVGGENIVHHTHQIKEEPAYRIVTRHLHYSLPRGETKEELQSKRHKVQNIGLTNVVHKKSKDFVFLFFIDLEP